MPGGRIDDEDVAKVREANDIVAVIGERSPVKQRGRDFWCCCPLHNEKTPSLKIDPELQLWHCFGCGEGGDVFGFVMRADDLSFPEAVRWLAERAHVEISESSREAGAASGKRARLLAVCAETRDFYHTLLMRGKSSEAAAARSYLSGRGFGGEVPKTWRLGFAPGRGALVRHLTGKGFSAEELVAANVALAKDGGKLRDRFFNRVIFPINDGQGDCIAFGGRVVGRGEPKYLNSNETPLFRKSRVLYGLDQAKSAIVATGTAVVVEGYTDVIALSSAGVGNVVATLGTALTRQHVRALSRYAKRRIVYLFDGDAAGQRAADRALAFIDSSMTPEAGKSRVEICAVTLPDDLDPAEFVAARGPDEMRALIDGARPLVQYGIERRLAAHDLASPEGRARAFSDALSVLAPIKDSLLAQDYAVQIAGRTRVREDDALAALAQLKPPRAVGDDDGAFAGPAREDAPAGQPARGALSPTERSRRRFERELLCIAAQHPETALAHADALAAAQWRDPSHRLIAEALLEALAADPAASPARLIEAATARVAAAAGILTSMAADGARSPEEAAAFLAEEIALGDLEDAVAALKAQLADPSVAGTPLADELFSNVAGMQRDLARRKAAHLRV